MAQHEDCMRVCYYRGEKILLITQLVFMWKEIELGSFSLIFDVCSQLQATTTKKHQNHGDGVFRPGDHDLTHKKLILARFRHGPP